MNFSNLYNGWVRSFGLFFLLLFAVTDVHAKLSIMHQTRAKDAQKQFFDPLYQESAYFRAMFNELHNQSDIEYVLLFADPELTNMFDSVVKKDRGYTYGLFMSPKDSEENYSEENLTKFSEPEKLKDFFAFMRGKPVILVFCYQQDSPMGKYYGVPRVTLLQETFHALQYEYYRDQGQPKKRFQPSLYPAREIESDLINLIAGITDDPTFQSKRGLQDMDGMDALLSYFHNIKKFNKIPSGTHKQYNETLMDAWNYVIENAGYKNEFEGTPLENVSIDLFDLETLHWFLKKHHFTR